MKYCKVCGYISDEEQTECPYCGEALIEKAASKASTAPEPSEKEEDRSPFKKYAEFLDDETLYRTAIMKIEGVGGDRNSGEAVEMLKTLAFRGHYDGMYKLAECLLSEDPPDEKTAVMWLKIAASGGHKPSRIRLQTFGAEQSVDSPIIFPDDASGFVTRVRAALPSIVTIQAAFVGKGGRTAYSAGSGFIVSGGYVVTNAHVVTAMPLSITAKFEPSIDDRIYNLIPVRIEVEQDIAVLRFTGLKDKQVSAAENLLLRMGDVQFGEDVYTIGNPLGLGLSVSRGVISCPSRESQYPSGVDHVIQTDISANHGNSGGALLDVNNKVLGMITFHPGEAKGGIAMCVPTDYIVKALNKLK